MFAAPKRWPRQRHSVSHTKCMGCSDQTRLPALPPSRPPAHLTAPRMDSASFSSTREVTCGNLKPPSAATSRVTTISSLSPSE